MMQLLVLGRRFAVHIILLPLIRELLRTLMERLRQRIRPLSRALMVQTLQLLVWGRRFAVHIILLPLIRELLRARVVCSSRKLVVLGRWQPLGIVLTAWLGRLLRTLMGRLRQRLVLGSRMCILLL